MQFKPSEAVAHLKESIANYIESQTRTSHALVFAKRSTLPREHGVKAQDPSLTLHPPSLRCDRKPLKI